MWENSLTIQQPFGISVFGAAQLKVAPDSALISAAVTRLEEKPADAFGKAKKSAKAVSDFLRSSGIGEFGTSRMTLLQESRFSNGEFRQLGYKVRVGFRVRVTALDRLEEIITGLIEAGANEIASIEFQTSELKEIRAKARRLAMEAAREKALIYCQAGNVALGSILHIQDVNPQTLQRVPHLSQISPRFHGPGLGEVSIADALDSEPEKHSLDPGAIEVGAAVVVAYALQPLPA
jgi:uncharacterized protein